MTDREKAIEILQRLADGKAEDLNIFDDEGGDVCGQILEEQDAILAGIEALKTERQHGEWIYHKYDKDFECSMCHYRFDEDEFGLEIPQENGTWVKVCVYNFCPNCGSENRPKDRPKEGE